MSAGRRTSLFRSNSTAPCIWPLRPMQAISAAGTPDSRQQLAHSALAGVPPVAAAPAPPNRFAEMQRAHARG